MTESTPQINPAFLVEWHWQPRQMPLNPAAVVVRGADATAALTRRLRERDDDSLARLTGVTGAGNGLLLVLGAAQDLPWVEGALYLGRDPDVPGLLLPTLLAPTVPLPLLIRALAKRFPNTNLPFALLCGDHKTRTTPTLIPLAAARPVTRGLLRQAQEQGQGQARCF